MHLKEYFETGNRLLQENRCDEAETLVAEGMERFPTNPQLRDCFARIAVRRQDTDEAARRYEALRQAFPEFLPGHLGCGGLLLRAGRFREAETLYAAVIEQFPDNVTAKERLAEAARRRGDTALALSRYQALIDAHPAATEGYLGQGNLLLAAERFDEALELFATAAARFPDRPEFAERLAFLAEKAGETQAAAERYAALLAAHPEFLPPYLAYGNILLAEGRHDEAETVFAEAARRFPNRGDLRERLATLAERRGDRAEAIRRYRHLVEHHPGLPVGYFGLGAQLARSRRFAEAEAVLAEGVRRFPDHAGLKARHEQTRMSMAIHTGNTDLVMECTLREWTANGDSSRNMAQQCLRAMTMLPYASPIRAVAANLLDTSLSPTVRDRLAYNLVVMHLAAHDSGAARAVYERHLADRPDQPAAALARAKLGLFDPAFPAEPPLPGNPDLAFAFEDYQFSLAKQAFLANDPVRLWAVSRNVDRGYAFYSDFEFMRLALEGDTVERLAARMDPDRNNILLLLSSARGSLLAPWLESVTPYLDRHNAVFLALDKPIYEGFAARGFADRTVLLDVHGDHHVGFRFTLALFRFRIMLLAQLLSRGVRLLMSGADAFWRKDIFDCPVITARQPHIWAGGAPATTTYMRTKWGATVLNMDTIFLDPREHTKALCDSIIRQWLLLGYPLAHDQDVLSLAVDGLMGENRFEAADDHFFLAEPLRILMLGRSVIDRVGTLDDFVEEAYIAHRPFYR